MLMTTRGHLNKQQTFRNFMYLGVDVIAEMEGNGADVVKIVDRFARLLTSAATAFKRRRLVAVHVSN